MTTLVLTFPTGHHPTLPWAATTGITTDAPPPLWSLLHALHTTWRAQVPALNESTVHALLAALATPPTYQLPRYATSAGGAVLEHDTELALQWPVRLPPDQHAALTQLADNLRHRHRHRDCGASVDFDCHARVDDTWTPHRHHRWEPAANPPGAAGHVVTVLAPCRPFDIETLLTHPADPSHPAAVPPGARLLAYQRQPATDAPSAAIRFTIIGRRPAATDTVAVTDLLRRAALHHLGTLRGTRARTRLAGHDADTSILRDQHDHTTYLPLLDGHTIAAVIAWTPAGLADDETTALRSITQLATRRSHLRLRLAPSPPDALSVLAPTLLGPATTWRSITPYTPARHPKRRDHRAFLLDDITQELHHRELSAPTTLDIIDRDWRTWRRHRPSAPSTSPKAEPHETQPFSSSHSPPRCAAPSPSATSATTGSACSYPRADQPRAPSERAGTAPTRISIRTQLTATTSHTYVPGTAAQPAVLP